MQDLVKKYFLIRNLKKPSWGERTGSQAGRQTDRQEYFFEPVRLPYEHTNVDDGDHLFTATPTSNLCHSLLQQEQQQLLRAAAQITHAQISDRLAAVVC